MKTFLTLALAFGLAASIGCSSSTTSAKPAGTGTAGSGSTGK